MWPSAFLGLITNLIFFVVVTIPSGIFSHKLWASTRWGKEEKMRKLRERKLEELRLFRLGRKALEEVLAAVMARVVVVVGAGVRRVLGKEVEEVVRTAEEKRKVERERGGMIGRLTISQHYIFCSKMGERGMCEIIIPKPNCATCGVFLRSLDFCSFLQDLITF
jgi:hypothetical protein